MIATEGLVMLFVMSRSSWLMIVAYGPSLAEVGAGMSADGCKCAGAETFRPTQ